MGRSIWLQFAAVAALLFSLYAFYSAIEFLVDKDYVAALLCIFIGLALVRSATEAQRLDLLRPNGATKRPLSDEQDNGAPDDRGHTTGLSGGSHASRVP